MITKETRGRILRLRLAELWTIGAIARELGIHHGTVRRALMGTEQAGSEGGEEALRKASPSLIDPYIPFILETLLKHPTLRASRLYAMCGTRGYSGRPDHFRHCIAQIRPRPAAEAFLRLRTLPGEQAQCDWAHFGTLQVGRACRKLYAFVMVLAWSRKVFLRFGFDIGMAGFVRGHVEAFTAFGGVPRVVLYDNLKSAVLERVGDTIVFHPQLLAIAGAYHYEPRPVGIRKGNEKGRVERAIQYIRHAFFAARTFSDLDDLNAQADAWCEHEAQTRKCPGDFTLSVHKAFELEGPALLALPADRFADHERQAVRVGKQPYVRFDLNDYSVPHALVQRQLVVFATTSTVQVTDGLKVFAEHHRSYDRGKQIEDPRHIADLQAEKARAHLHRNQQLLMGDVPQAEALLQQLGDRGANLGSAVAALLQLLDSYGSAQLGSAIEESLKLRSTSAPTVRQILERRRAAIGLPPPVQIPLPTAAQGPAVRTQSFADYQQLGQRSLSTSQTAVKGTSNE